MAKKREQRSPGDAENGEPAVAYDWTTELPGVFSRHSDKCPIRDGSACTCGTRGYRASVRDRETNVRIVSPKFESLSEALAWQRDQRMDQEDRPVAADGTEVGALIDEFLQAVEDGVARDPRGQPYTRESLHALRGALSYVESELGSMTVQDVRRRHIQGLITQLRGSGLDPARIFAVVNGLNALFSFAIRREVVGFSPVVELELLESERGVSYVDMQSPTSFNTPGVGTAPPVSALGDPRTPHPYAAQVDPRTSFPFWAPGNASGGFTSPHAEPPSQLSSNGSGPFSSMFGTSGTTAPDANYDATMQERWLWWTVRIIVIVFVLISLVLVAESV